MPSTNTQTNTHILYVCIQEVHKVLLTKHCKLLVVTFFMKKVQNKYYKYNVRTLFLDHECDQMVMVKAITQKTQELRGSNKVVPTSVTLARH